MGKAARLAFGIGLVLAACGATAPPLPADAIVLPEAVANLLLAQCSRGVPPAYEGHWLPAADDIAALEAALPRALATAQPGDAQLRNAPQGWRRQYGGFRRGGRRFIYGNFFPREVGDDPDAANDWRHAPVMICDGGHAFFGVEYDVDARRFTHLGFNGYA
jgi:hypothetical protein